MKFTSLRLLFGIFVLVGLFLANTLTILAPEGLVKTGARNSPPSSILLQKWLYNNPIEINEVSRNWLFFDEITSDSNSSIEVANAYFNKIPNRTAIVSREYSFKPAKLISESVVFEINTAPNGFEFNGREFEWTPTDQQIGTHKIVLIAIDNSLDKSYQIEYFIYVNSAYLLLGSDNRGRSLLGLIILGASWTILPGLIACFFSVILGLCLGALSGYYEGYFGRVFNRISLVIESIPALIIIFLAAVISSFNIYIIMIFTGLVLFPANYENIKLIVKTFKNGQFVESSKEIGFKNSTILWRDIIWYNCKPTIIKQVSYCFVFAITIEITLSYLQIGIQPPNVSWGMLLYEGRSMLITGGYWMTVFPSLAIVLTLTGFYLLGNSLSTIFDPRK
jgi:ABC-type dipeptide/oligopeptide/nickel transport system permease subunit